MNGASEAEKRLRSLRTLGLFMSVRGYRHLGPYGPEDEFFRRQRRRGTGPRTTVRPETNPENLANLANPAHILLILKILL